LEGGPPRFSPRFTGADLLRDTCGRSCDFAYGTIALCGARVPRASTIARLCNFRRIGHDPDQAPYNPRRATRGRLHTPGLGWIPFRSPLLRESRLISFPRGTEMFHFPRLSSRAYVFSAG
jgi:hypothetical protein